MSSSAAGGAAVAERIGTCGRPRPLRLAVLITHPIQYFKPVFQALAQEEAVELLVVFGCDHGLRTSLDPDFGVPFAWDSSPAEGFPHGVIATVPLAALSDWRQALPLARQAVARIGAFRPDAVLVFAYTPAYITLATSLLRLRGHRLMLRADGTDRAFVRSPLKSLLKDLGLRCWYGMFQHVFPIGSDSDDHFHRLGVPPTRRTAVAYAVDVDYFATQVAHWRPRRPALRRALDLPEEGLVLLWCGKITAVKNPALLVAGLERLEAAERSGLWLVVVGDGLLRQEFERQAQRLLPGRCRFVGFRNQSELGSFYALADGLVFPSRQGETWGLVVNEALQFGLPVLVSDHAGCARDLVAPPAGVPPGSAVFASDNPDALATALRVWLAAPRPLPPQQGFWTDSASSAVLAATPSPAAKLLPHPGDLARAVLRQVRRLGGR